jgi:hypothetical protein
MLWHGELRLQLRLQLLYLSLHFHQMRLLLLLRLLSKILHQTNHRLIACSRRIFSIRRMIT